MNNLHKIRSIILPFLLICVIALSALIPAAFYVVTPGFAAIQLRLGRIIKTEKQEGYYFKLPGLDTVTFFDLRIKKAAIETKALSKDLQGVSVGLVINYRIQDAVKIYKNIGTHFEAVIIDPFAQESVKAIVAKFNAENLIQRRHEAKDMVINELRERLASRNIELVDFNFTHLDFSDDFIHAVEAKQIAEQSAKRAENLTKQVIEEAKQSRTRAEAEAFALQVKRQSVTAELIELQKVEAQLKAIEKWDGHLPKFTGDATPLISFN